MTSIEIYKLARLITDKYFKEAYKLHTDDARMQLLTGIASEVIAKVEKEIIVSVNSNFFEVLETEDYLTDKYKGNNK